jgi:hypothetical protein
MQDQPGALSRQFLTPVTHPEAAPLTLLPCCCTRRSPSLHKSTGITCAIPKRQRPTCRNARDGLSNTDHSAHSAGATHQDAFTRQLQSHWILHPAAESYSLPEQGERNHVITRTVLLNPSPGPPVPFIQLSQERSD